MSTELDRNQALLLGLSTIPSIGRKSVTSVLSAANFSYEIFFELSQNDIEAALKQSHIPQYRKSALLIEKARGNGMMQRGFDLLQSAIHQNISILHGPEIPLCLREIPSAPEILFVKGNKNALFAPFSVAIVGTRKPTEKGLKAIKHIVSCLVRLRKELGQDITIISGLAEGIDAEAHRYSLKHGFKNVAFLGCGVDIVFPKLTEQYRDPIIKGGGAIVSEYFPGETYAKHKFVHRNRLQAGLADVVIAVEAAEKSGTAHTVKFAHSFGKVVIGIDLGESGGISDLINAKNVYNIFNVAEKSRLLNHLKAVVSLEYQIERKPAQLSFLDELS